MIGGAKDLWEAKKVAIQLLKVPLSKWGEVALEPGYDEEDELLGWIAFYKGQRADIYKQPGEQI